jgi:type II secretory pathway pseudopilin PulG
MVAIAIFAIVSAIAMTLYQQLQKNFKQGENLVAQQQNTRVAFDRMISDLRMAGFNYNPDGDTGRPDEQIEGMWSNAITVRGDYDYETADANTPESTLGGSTATFDLVSTGNDEIVTYALAKPSGTGGTTLQFQADVGSVPRDGTVDTVNVNNVFLDMNSPPYTLYRIVLTSSGQPDRQPIADNIRSLAFTYYDAVGNVLTTMAGGMDTQADKDQRKRIARIGVNVVGMTQDPDLAYFDAGDTNPLSTHHRKFELSSDVAPRNLGFVGIPDLDLDDPNTPTGLSVCAGHCRGLRGTWNPNPPGDGTIKYEVTYGASQASQGNAQDTFSPSIYVGGLTTGSSYVIAVGAVDATGNISDPRAYSSPSTVANRWRPEAPTGMTASSISGLNAKPNRIDVGWATPTANAPDPNGAVCDPADPNSPTISVYRDPLGFRLFRGATAGFDPNVPAQVQASWDPNTLTSSTTSFTDPPDPNVPSVVNCRTYYYKAVAEDLCGLQSVVTVVPAAGSASSAVPPLAPLNVTATDMGLQQSLLMWNAVTSDTSPTPAPILIDTYTVYRTVIPTGGDPNTVPFPSGWTQVHDGTVASPGSPSYTDFNVPNVPSSQSYYYLVTARDDCPNESAPSMPALLAKCSFGGSVQVSMSPGGNPVTGSQIITVQVTPGVTPVRGTLTIRDAGTGAIILNQTASTYPYVFTWNTAVPPTVVGRSYDVAAAVTNAAGCTETQVTTISVSGSSACCISATNPRLTSNTALGSVGGGTKNNEVGFEIINNCGDDVDIEGLALDWTDRACPNRSNPQLAGWTFQSFPDVVLSPPVNPVSSLLSPTARFNLTVSPFTVYDVGSGDTASVSYIFTKAMAFQCAGTPVGNVINTEYFYRLTSSGAGGRCTVTILADPTTPGITLCDPVFDPNCPGF